MIKGKKEGKTEVQIFIKKGRIEMRYEGKKKNIIKNKQEKGRTPKKFKGTRTKESKQGRTLGRCGLPNGTQAGSDTQQVNGKRKDIRKGGINNTTLKQWDRHIFMLCFPQLENTPPFQTVQEACVIDSFSEKKKSHLCTEHNKVPSFLQSLVIAIPTGL